MNKIKKLRLERGWTQEDLGKLLNVQKAAISKYENGIASPSIEILKTMSSLFGVSIDYLLDNDKKSQLMNKFLSDEQSSLLKKYDALADDGRQLIQSLLNSLLISHPKKSSGVIQGDNKFVNGSGETNYLTT